MDKPEGRQRCKNVFDSLNNRCLLKKETNALLDNRFPFREHPFSEESGCSGKPTGPLDNRFITLKMVEN